MIFNNNFCLQKPEISYPCEWEYKIILDKNINVNTFLFDILDCDFKVFKSKNTPKYTSYNVKIRVLSQKQRIEIFNILKKKCKYVL